MGSCAGPASRRPASGAGRSASAQEGYDGLLRDKTRPSRIPPLGPEVAERVVALTLSDPPAEATHWVAAMMAKATGISVSSVQRIWRAHGLRPHRVRQFKLSNDPDFVAKLRDVVGLYVDPPAHAIVLLGRRKVADPGARPHPARPADEKGPSWHHDPRLQAAWHDHPVAALNVLEGKVIGRCMQRHRHQEFIRLPQRHRGRYPGRQGRPCDPRQLRRPQACKVRAWIGRHERFTFHFVPTSCSWLNAVEGFFAKLSKRRLKRASSAPLSTQSPSTASSTRPTTTQSPSPGPPIQTKSSPPSNEGIKC